MALDSTVVKTSPEVMRLGEGIAFTIDFSDTGTPSSPVITAYDADGNDVSGTTLAGSASVNGDIVTLKKFTPATAQVYRLVCQVTISGNTVIGLVDINVIATAPGLTITNGYTTIDKAKNELMPFAKTDTIDDSVIADLIEEASRVIDKETGRTFYPRTETRYYNLPDGRSLFLDEDLLTITTLTNGDGNTIADTEYILLPKNTPPYYEIRLKASSSYRWTYDSSGNSESVISVAGTWGYSATTPDDINRACKMLVSHYYRLRHGEGVTSSSLVTPAGVVVSPHDIPGPADRILRYYKRRLL